MRKENVLILSVLIHLLFNSCIKQNESDANNEKVSFFKNGNLKKKAFRKDSLYIVVQYDSSGCLIDSTSFDVNQNMTGIRKHLHKDSNTPYYSYVAYKNNIKEGDAWGVHLNGVKKFDGMYENNNKVRSWNYFGRNGKRLTYEFFSLSGKRTYLRKYKNGVLQSVQGNGIGYWAYDNDTINQGSKMAVRVGYANPPNCNVRVFVAEELDKNKEPKGDLTEYLVEENQDEFTYVRRLISKGLHEKGFGWIALDTINKNEETDYDVLDLMVK
ncbi:MAG: hypothetical protein RIC95_03100 [Vicingaceae bacterium]